MKVFTSKETVVIREPLGALSVDVQHLTTNDAARKIAEVVTEAKAVNPDAVYTLTIHSDRSADLSAIWARFAILTGYAEI